MKPLSPSLRSLLPLFLACSVAPIHATVTALGVDTTTIANWRSGANPVFAPDGQYGTSGYVVFGLNEANGVYTGGFNAGSGNPKNAYSLPGGIGLTIQDTNIGMWSGNGNFGQMQDPGAGNALTPTPLLANSAGPKRFTITRGHITPMRLAVLTASGDNAGATYSPSVNDGSGAVGTSHTHTANGLVYHVFDISADDTEIVIAIASTPNWSVTGFAFDDVTAPPPVGDPLTWVGTTSAWDTVTPGNWKKTADNTPALYSNAVRSALLFDDSASGKIVDLSTVKVAPLSLTFDAAANYTLQGSQSVAGATGLAKTGTGDLTIANANTFSGPTTIQAGSLTLAGSGLLGNGNYSPAIVNDGTLNANGSAAQTFSGIVSGTGSLVKNGSGDLNLTNASNSFSGNITVSAGTLIGRAATGTSATGCFGNNQVAGKTITVNAGATLRHGGNDLYFNGAAAHAAAQTTIVLDGGTMDTGTFYSAIKNLELRSGATINGTNGVVPAFRSLALCGNVTCTGGTGALSTIAAPGATGGIHLGHSGFGVASVTFDIDAASGGLEIAGPLVDQSNSGAPGALVKTGNGTLTLGGTATHTYTGATTVNNGTLTVNGALAASTNPITVNDTATLGGTGSLGRPVVVASGGKISPAGPAIGTLTADTLTLQAGAKTVCQIDKTGGLPAADLLDTQSVTYGGTLEVTATGETLALGDTFKLFHAVSAYGGSFAAATMPALPAGLNWDLAGLTVDGTVKVVNTAATPLFSPPPGGYVGARSIVISSDPGTTIHYTTDGSDPLVSPTAVHVASPASVNIPADSPGVTIKAYTSQPGFTDSAVVTVQFSTVTTPAWNVDDNGAWSEAAKWKHQVIADGTGVTADFSSFPQTGDATVTLDSNRTVGSLLFGNVNEYSWAIAGPASNILTLATASGTPAVEVINQTATIGVPLAGTQGLAKTGAGTLRLSSAASTFTGDLTVAAGALEANASSGGPAPLSSSLGNPAVPRTISVDRGASLSFGANDTFGNHAAEMRVAMAIAGTVTNGGNWYNALGPLTFQGGTLHATGGANANFPAFALKGTVTALTGTASAISGSGTNATYQLGCNLATGTTFDIQGNATLDVPAVLGNGRALNYAAQPSFLTKDGTGTLTLGGNNTYTGDTTVNAGTLALADGARILFAIGAASGTNNRLAGSGTVALDGAFAIDTTAAAALDSGTWLLEDVNSLAGAYGSTFTVVSPDGTPWTDAGNNKWTLGTGTGKTWTFDETTGTLSLGSGGNYASWALENGVTGGTNDDSDHDGTPNLVEYALDLHPAGPDGSPGRLTGLLLAFTKRAVAVANGDVAYAIEESDDLGLADPWQAVTPLVNDATTISYQLPAGSQRKFARLVVTQTP